MAPNSNGSGLFSSPMPPSDESESGYEGDMSRVNVFVRVRPLKQQKSSKDKNGATERAVRLAGDKGVRIAVTKKSEKTFVYDRLFGEKDGQQRVYDVTGRPVIQDVLKGYNGCIMAYGQTGAGKTHSLLNMANSSSSQSGQPGGGEAGQPGLVPRIVTDLYIAMAADFMGMFTVSVAMCQIYNEQIDDLLKPKNTNLRLVMSSEEKEKSWVVEGLSWYKCKTPEYLLSVISNGRKRLIYAETEMNKHSSRSHAVLMIKVQRHNRSDVMRKEQMDKEARENASDDDDSDSDDGAGATGGGASVQLRGRQGILSIIDLAGSERVKKSKSSGVQFTEAKKINNSLLVLGQCVQALAFKKTHVPYRDSVLTKFLEPSLSGTSRVNLLVCVSPERVHANESMSTLEFAYRAMSVPTSPTVNEMTVCTSPKALIADLATAASVVQLEQTEALQRITEEKMRMEEEIGALRGEKSEAAQQREQKAQELRELRARHGELERKFESLQSSALKITAEAVATKQDLQSARESARQDLQSARESARAQQERDHETQVRLGRENERLKSQLGEALDKIRSLEGDLTTQQEQLREHISRIQWIEESIDFTQNGAAEIEQKMGSMVDILDQTNTKIEGLETALSAARSKAQTLGRRCESDSKQWAGEKSVLHALVTKMQKTISRYEHERCDLESRAVASSVAEEILWRALALAKDKQIESEKRQVKEGVEVSAKVKSQHMGSLDEWLKSGIPVIKWGRNNKKYNRLVRVSADGKFLEWIPMSGSKKNKWVLPSLQLTAARRFKLQDIRSINTSEFGGKGGAEEVVYSVQVGLPERDVRMDLSSPQAFAWFESLKARGLNIT